MKRLFLALALAVSSLAAVSCGRSDGINAPVRMGNALVSGVLLEKDDRPMQVDGGLVLWIAVSGGGRQRAALPSLFGNGGNTHVQELYAIAQRLVVGQRLSVSGERYGDTLMVSDIRILR